MLKVNGVSSFFSAQTLMDLLVGRDLTVKRDAIIKDYITQIGGITVIPLASGATALKVRDYANTTDRIVLTEDGNVTVGGELFIKNYVPASYIIFKDGDYIKARNGTTGQIDFSGTNAATVIQQAINSLMSKTDYERGRILIKAGTYSLSTSIGWTLSEDRSVNIDLEGEGAATRLIQQPASTPLIKVQTTTGNIRRIRIANMTLYGGTKAIELRNAYYNIFENLYMLGQSSQTIDDLGGSSINKFSRLMVVHTVGGIRLLGFGNMIVECNFGEDIQTTNIIRLEGHSNMVIGCYLQSGSPNYFVGISVTGDRNMIIGNYIYDTLRGVSCFSNRNVFAFNVFDRCQREAIAVWNFTSGSYCVGNRIIGNYITNTGLDSTWAYRTGITLYRAQGTVVAFNMIDSVPSYSVQEVALPENDNNYIAYNMVSTPIYKYGPNSMMVNNIGYGYITMSGLKSYAGTSKTVTETTLTLKDEVGPLANRVSLLPMVIKYSASNPTGSGATLYVTLRAVYTDGTTTDIDSRSLAAGTSVDVAITGEALYDLLSDGKILQKIQLLAYCSTTPATGYEPSVILSKVAGVSM
jgi:hypothetical protein